MKLPYTYKIPVTESVSVEAFETPERRQCGCCGQIRPMLRGTMIFNPGPIVLAESNNEAIEKFRLLWEYIVLPNFGRKTQGNIMTENIVLLNDLL